MTRDDTFIEQLETYLDEYDGLTPLPDIVRDAVRAALPSTKQVGPMQGLRRYFTMSLSTPAQLAIAAAAVIVVVVVGAAALNGQNIASPPSVTPSPSEAGAAPSSGPTKDPCEGEAVSVVGPTTLAIAWCPPEGDNTIVAFIIEAPADWAETWYGGSNNLYLLPAGGGALALAVGGAGSVDAWVEAIRGTEAYLVSEPQAVSLGGAAGYVMDVTLAPGADSGQAPPLFEDQNLPWNITGQDPVRVWVIDYDGQPLMIVTRPGTPAEFDAWTSAVGEALQTIEWGP
jgi:hypothetical protein